MASKLRAKYNSRTSESSDFPELLNSPVNIRSIALIGIFVLALLYTLYFARFVFLPITLALMLSFLLVPIVRFLKKLRIPEGIGAALLLFALAGVVFYGATRLADPAATWISRAPESLRQIQQKFRPVQESIEQLDDAAEKVEDMAGMGESRNAQKVETKRFNLLETLLTEMTNFAVGAALVFILLYFLLASGDLFLRKLVKVLPRLQDKKQAVEILRETENHISHYLSTVTIINCMLGVSVAIAMKLLGMPNPILWGVMAAAVNFVPYLGPTVGVVVLTLASTLTFEPLGRALLIPLVYFMMTALEGYFITPMILGQRLTLNPVVIFTSLIFWGWLWGIPGALLAVPLLVTLKISCDRIESLSRVGEFLGR